MIFSLKHILFVVLRTFPIFVLKSFDRGAEVFSNRTPTSIRSRPQFCPEMDILSAFSCANSVE